MQERNNTTSPTPVTSAPTPDLTATLLRVAWAAILLGLVMEAVLILLGTGLGEALGLGKLTADLVKNVSWSLFVCGGLAVGTTIANARLPLAGLAGLLAAPLAFEISRVLHKGTLEMLAASSGASEGASPVLIAVVKGLEYGALGMAIRWLARRSWAGAMAYALTGLLIGTVFGGAILTLTLGAASQISTGTLISQAVNEILFPVGCALVLFSANFLGKRMTR